MIHVHTVVTPYKVFTSEFTIRFGNCHMMLVLSSDGASTTELLSAQMWNYTWVEVCPLDPDKSAHNPDSNLF